MINWKLRIQNKITFISGLVCLLGLIYQILAIMGITIPVTQDQAGQIVNLILNALVTIGVLIDPTTAGVKDSNRAMKYDKPI